MNGLPKSAKKTSQKSTLKFPMLDRFKFGDNIEVIGTEGPHYSAGFSVIVTPKFI